MFDVNTLFILFHLENMSGAIWESFWRRVAAPVVTFLACQVHLYAENVSEVECIRCHHITMVAYQPWGSLCYFHYTFSASSLVCSWQRSIWVFNWLACSCVVLLSLRCLACVNINLYLCAWTSKLVLLAPPALDGLTFPMSSRYQPILYVVSPLRLALDFIAFGLEVGPGFAVR